MHGFYAFYPLSKYLHLRLLSNLSSVAELESSLLFIKFIQNIHTNLNIFTLNENTLEMNIIFMEKFYYETKSKYRCIESLKGIYYSYGMQKGLYATS